MSLEESPGPAVCLRTSYRTLRSGHEQNCKYLEVWLLSEVVEKSPAKTSV